MVLGCWPLTQRKQRSHNYHVINLVTSKILSPPISGAVRKIWSLAAKHTDVLSCTKSPTVFLLNITVREILALCYTTASVTWSRLEVLEIAWVLTKGIHYSIARII